MNMRKAVVIRNETGDEAAAIYSIKRVRDTLVMEGKALGTMQMDMILSTQDALRAAQLMFSWAVISFVLLLPFYALRNAIGRQKQD